MSRWTSAALLLATATAASSLFAEASARPGPPDSESIRYVTAGDYLVPGRTFRAAEFVAVVAGLPAWRETDPELYRRVRGSLLERLPAQAGPLMDYLAPYASDPCLRRRVRMNLERASFQDFYQRTVEAGARFGQACGDLRRTDYRSARAHLDEALALSPDFLDAYRHRAIVESLSGEDEKAGVDYREGRKTVKDDREVPAGACLCLPGLAAASGRLEERMRRGEALTGEGIALFLKGERPAAARKFDEAVASNPGDAQAYQSRAVVREASGDEGGAAADYEKVAALSSRQPESRASAWLSLARLREQAGDPAGVERDLANALSAAPADWPDRGAARRRLTALSSRRRVRGLLASLRSGPPRLARAARDRVRAGSAAVWGGLGSAGRGGRRAAAFLRGALARRVRGFVSGPWSALRRRTAALPGRIAARGDSLRRAGADLARRSRQRVLWLWSGSSVRILSPFDGTVFPADIRSPEIRWEDYDPQNKVWLIQVSVPEAPPAVEAFTEDRQWTPPRDVWETIKKASLGRSARLAVYGLRSRSAPYRGSSRVAFTTSRDEVGAPIFFRAVPTPFPPPKDYVKVKWKLGRVSSYDPPRVVMQKQALCYNCHALSLNGKTLGFEVNPLVHGQEDRGGYLLYQDPGKTVVWRRANYFDWNDYAPAAERRGVQGFRSEVSPNGDYVVTSGKAMTSVTFNPCRDLVDRDRGGSCQGLFDYSLVTKGILLYYSTREKVIRALPGADDERFVHMPTSWSPDGKSILFARAPITPQFDELNRHPMSDEVLRRHVKLGLRELDRIYPMKYDLYRIPFNGGQGGVAAPVAGASRNGKSNYGGRISPDGKWIVFTQSASGLMFMRSDSELYIVPAGGGKARRLKCNRPGGNSWHSWSPNSRWLVFSSKAYGPKTDLVLTHIDENGDDSPPVALTSMRDGSGLAANLPEFFNIQPGRLEAIIPRFDSQLR